MRRGDQSLYRTFTNLDLQTLLEFRGWPTAEQVEADEEADRLAALLSPETLDKIDAVLAEVDAGIPPTMVYQLTFRYRKCDEQRRGNSGVQVGEQRTRRADRDS